MYSPPDSSFVPKEVSEGYSHAKARASNWRQQLEDVRELVRPNASEFMGSTGRGKPRSAKIYDSTAPWALEQLASGLHSYMTDPSGRWFMLGIQGVPTADIPFPIAAWLESATDRLFAEFANPASRFQQTVKEVYLDFASFGTGIQFENWDYNKKCVLFRSRPLAKCFIDEGYDGSVNHIYYDEDYKLTEINRMFPNAALPDSMLKAGPEAEFTVTHAVCPNEKYFPGYKANLGKKFSSYFFVESEKGFILSQGGFDRLPYQVPRWTTVPGEVYGRGPAMTALPDIQLLNIMNKELIMAAQLANRPPLALDDDSFLLPISYTPGSLIFKTPGTDAPEPILGGGNFNITLELMQQKREQIAKTFHVDWLLRGKKKERQSVYEVTDDRQEMLRQIASITGRIETDHLSPTIHNTFYLLQREGQLPPPPPELQGVQLEIVYTSSASKAQMSAKADAISQFMTEMTPLYGVDPSIFDGIELSRLGAEQAILRDITHKVRSSPEQIAAKQRQRQQEKQAQTGLANAQQAGTMAGALKDVATAQEKGLTL